MKTLKSIVQTFAVLAVLFGGYLFLEFNNFSKVEPEKNNISDWTSFQKSGKEVFNYKLREFEGQKYLLVVLSSSPFFVPSGLPAYVFNSKGELVDWAADIGDNSRFDSKWSAQKQTNVIDINAVELFLKQEGL